MSPKGLQGDLGQETPTTIHQHGQFTLFLGDVFHAVDPGLLDGLGISHLLCVASKCRLPPGCAARQVVTIPLPESGQCDLTVAGAIHVDNTEPILSLARLDQCFEFINRAKASSGNVLVFCSNGNGRAAAVTLAWLIHSKGMTLQEGIAFLREKRPSAKPSGEYVEQLKAYEQRKLGSGSVEGNPFADA